jgi:hypothetical protein
MKSAAFDDDLYYEDGGDTGYYASSAAWPTEYSMERPTSAPPAHSTRLPTAVSQALTKRDSISSAPKECRFMRQYDKDCKKKDAKQPPPPPLWSRRVKEAWLKEETAQDARALCVRSKPLVAHTTTGPKPFAFAEEGMLRSKHTRDLPNEDSNLIRKAASSMPRKARGDRSAEDAAQVPASAARSAGRLPRYLQVRKRELAAEAAAAVAAETARDAARVGGVHGVVMPKAEQVAFLVQLRARHAALLGQFQRFSHTHEHSSSRRAFIESLVADMQELEAMIAKILCPIVVVR